MSDDKTNRGPHDRNLISLSEPYEIRDWARRFGVTEDELRASVSKVGPSTEAVSKALSRPLTDD